MGRFISWLLGLFQDKDNNVTSKTDIRLSKQSPLPKGKRDKSSELSKGKLPTSVGVKPVSKPEPKPEPEPRPLPVDGPVLTPMVACWRNTPVVKDPSLAVGNFANVHKLATENGVLGNFPWWWRYYDNRNDKNEDDVHGRAPITEEVQSETRDSIVETMLRHIENSTPGTIIGINWEVGKGHTFPMGPHNFDTGHFPNEAKYRLLHSMQDQCAELGIDTDEGLDIVSRFYDQTFEFVAALLKREGMRFGAYSPGLMSRAHTRHLTTRVVGMAAYDSDDQGNTRFDLMSGSLRKNLQEGATKGQEVFPLVYHTYTFKHKLRNQLMTEEDILRSVEILKAAGIVECGLWVGNRIEDWEAADRYMELWKQIAGAVR